MIAMAFFTTKDIPDLSGRLAVVTGANSGTGYETALELARKGAEVVIAARNPAKGDEAIRRIRREVPAASVRFATLDLADQASVRAFAERMLANGRPIDVLVNNAGVMALPTREVTVDGFELQLATNYLGHFALTALLLPLLKAGGARVVQLSSIAHRQGRIRFDDPNLHDRLQGLARLCAVQAGDADVRPGARSSQQGKRLGADQCRGSPRLRSNGADRERAADPVSRCKGRAEPGLPAVH